MAKDMNYNSGINISDTMMYLNNGVMLNNIGDSIEFDMYGDEIAICQMKRVSTDYGSASVYANNEKIGTIFNYNPYSQAEETFNLSNGQTQVLLKHNCTFDHEIYVNNNSTPLDNVLINTGGYGYSIPSTCKAFIFRKPTDNGRGTCHAIMLRGALTDQTTVTKLRVVYKYGRKVAYEASTVGMVGSNNEYSNESYYGSGAVSFDPANPSGDISAGLEFRAVDKRHFKITLDDYGVSPYIIINFATNRYFNLMNAGIGGWKLPLVLGYNTESKQNHYTGYTKYFEPDIIFEEACGNDDWDFSTFRINRLVGSYSSYTEFKNIHLIDIRVAWNPSTNKYNLYSRNGIISAITENTLTSTDIIGTDTQIGDIVRIGTYYGDDKEFTCRRIKTVDLNAGIITWENHYLSMNL